MMPVSVKPTLKYIIVQSYFTRGKPYTLTNFAMPWHPVLELGGLVFVVCEISSKDPLDTCLDQ